MPVIYPRQGNRPAPDTTFTDIVNLLIENKRYRDEQDRLKRAEDRTIEAEKTRKAERKEDVEARDAAEKRMQAVNYRAWQEYINTLPPDEQAQEIFRASQQIDTFKANFGVDFSEFDQTLVDLEGGVVEDFPTADSENLPPVRQRLPEAKDAGVPQRGTFPRETLAAQQRSATLNQTLALTDATDESRQASFAQRAENKRQAQIEDIKVIAQQTNEETSNVVNSITGRKFSKIQWSETLKDPDGTIGKFVREHAEYRTPVDQQREFFINMFDGDKERADKLIFVLNAENPALAANLEIDLKNQQYNAAEQIAVIRGFEIEDLQRQAAAAAAVGTLGGTFARMTPKQQFDAQAEIVKNQDDARLWLGNKLSGSSIRFANFTKNSKDELVFNKNISPDDAAAEQLAGKLPADLLLSIIEPMSFPEFRPESYDELMSASDVEAAFKRIEDWYAIENNLDEDVTVFIRGTEIKIGTQLNQKETQDRATLITQALAARHLMYDKYFALFGTAPPVSTFERPNTSSTEEEADVPGSDDFFVNQFLSLAKGYGGFGPDAQAEDAAKTQQIIGSTEEELRQLLFQRERLQEQAEAPTSNAE